MDDIDGYAVSSNEYNGPPSPLLQVYDEYEDAIKYGQNAAHYVAAMSDNGRQVVHVQVGFKLNKRWLKNIWTWFRIWFARTTSMDRFGKMMIMKNPEKLSKPGIYGT